MPDRRRERPRRAPPRDSTQGTDVSGGSCTRQRCYLRDAPDDGHDPVG